ncbi:glycoside hydrolase family 10 protein [Methanobrevibacter curvatus]|uniref:DUF4015 domain-containing protein n=1 Tax=Methanobrevibacter curvatus TaxID=49547 RepID=A0A166AZ51_9EURY|nr:hypothetical protein [Methanobrevibacter curvatus]KZX12656.1 hypothetical protein MBCUR_09860 [Methanobrevibacter curvatus]
MDGNLLTKKNNEVYAINSNNSTSNLRKTLLNKKTLKIGILIFLIFILATNACYAASSSQTTKISQNNIIKSSQSVDSFIAKNHRLPNTVKVDSYTFSQKEYFYLISKAISKRYEKSNGSISAIKSIKYSSKKSYVKINPETKNIYYNTAKSLNSYIEKNKKITTHIKYYNKLYKKDYVFKELNKYVKKMKLTPSTLGTSANKIPISKSKTAIWVQGGDMLNVNLSTLKSYGIGNIFLSFSVFNKYDNDTLKNWFSQANSKGIKIHIWMQAFYLSGKWTNPIDAKSGKINQSHLNKTIAEAKEYANFKGVSGIHLDYLRYPGTAYKTPGASDGINTFASEIKNAVKSINSKIIFSAAIMPEKSANIRYYGQNTTALGSIFDVLIPMAYKGNYEQNTNWIKSTLQWFVSNSPSAEIWGGLQTYGSDEKLVKFSTSQLGQDISALLSSGSKGVVLFRWGLLNPIFFK